MQSADSKKRTLLAMLLIGLKTTLSASGIVLLMAVTGCSLTSSKSVREIKVPVPIEVPRKVNCQTLAIPRIPELSLTWHPVPISWMRQFVSADEEHKNLLDYSATLPPEIIGLSPADYEQFAIFFIDLESWMKAKNAQVELLGSCIDRHNIQADEYSKSVSH